MKKVYILFLISLLLFLAALYITSLLKTKTIASLKKEKQRVLIYKSYGFNVDEFERLYLVLLKEADNTYFLLFPFKTKALQAKHDNILRLIQAGYATEMTKQKETAQQNLSYLRDRVKNTMFLTDERKKQYFDFCDQQALDVFEGEASINTVNKAISAVTSKSATFSEEVERVRLAALKAEAEQYREKCNELYFYFQQKNSSQNTSLAADCINKIDALMPQEAFNAYQQALAGKQKIVQEEQYAREAKRKQEEYLTLVPPAPRQEGKVVVVNLSLQRLYAYENGKSIYANAVPITTGKYGFETVTGEFAIYLKEEQHRMVSPFPGIFYDDVVNYWMPFYLGYGLHDAPWRSVYGTQDYPVVGSHGCVNMPLKDVIVLYNWAEVGTKVIVI